MLFNGKNIQNRDKPNAFFTAFTSGSQIHDLDVRVGSNRHNMKLCGHFTGHASLGQRIAFWCPSKTTGRYVKLQIMAGHVNRLSPAEVLVWGLHVY